MSRCHSVIFRGRCGSRRQTGMLEQQCKLYYCSLSPQCHSVIFRGRCGSGRLTCIHTQQYKLLHYYKNCVLILMRVTAAISHPHPALSHGERVFLSPQCHSVIFRGRCGGGRLTCIHTQQYKLLHYYKNCVLILMRVTASISHLILPSMSHN